MVRLYDVINKIKLYNKSLQISPDKNKEYAEVVLKREHDVIVTSVRDGFVNFFVMTTSRPKKFELTKLKINSNKDNDYLLAKKCYLLDFLSLLVRHEYPSSNKFQAKSQISVKLSLLDKKTEIFYHEFDSVLSEDLKTKDSYQEKLIFVAEKLKQPVSVFEIVPLEHEREGYKKIVDLVFVKTNLNNFIDPPALTRFVTVSSDEIDVLSNMWEVSDEFTRELLWPVIMDNCVRSLDKSESDSRFFWDSLTNLTENQIENKNFIDAGETGFFDKGYPQLEDINNSELE